MRRAGEQARGYPSDLTDAQWQVIAVHLPAEVPGRRGRPRVWPLRQIVEAILYLDRTGCAWRYLPSDFPPWGTVYGYFAAWRDDGTLARLHDALRAQVRAAAGRNPEPTAAITILVPILLPIVHKLGIDPVHFGLVMVLNLMIGLLHPPLGTVLFVLSRTARLSVERTTMAILPWLVPLLAALIVCTYVPEIVLWLPRQFF